MGIYVNLNIIPGKVGKKLWLETYKEAKKLINSYPFSDIVNGYQNPRIFGEHIKRI